MLAVELLEVELLAAALSVVLVALDCWVAVVPPVDVWLAPVFDCSWVSQACKSLASCWNGSVEVGTLAAVPEDVLPEVPDVLPLLTGVRLTDGAVRAVVALDQMLDATLLMDMAISPEQGKSRHAAQLACQMVSH